MAYDKEQGTPTLPHLAPPISAPLPVCLFSQEANPYPQISKYTTEKRVARTVAESRSGLNGYELCDHRSR